MALRALTLMVCLIATLASPAQAAKNHKVAPKTLAKNAVYQAPNPLNNPRFAALIIDAGTGRVLQSADADGLRHPASLTKMMTVYQAFQALDSGRLHLQDELFVSPQAAAMSPTKLGLRPGERITVENCILGMVTESANDAAVVMAEALGGGSEARFAERMTQTAHQLGMKDTVYKNASGLPNDDQITTARDMAKLALALQRHFPQYYHYFSTPAFTYKGAYHANHNHLMERYEGMDGIKTGYVRASGFNLVASVKRNNKRLIGVIFGGPSAAGRDAQLARMLDVAFASINNGELPKTQMAQAEAPVKLGAAAGSPGVPITQAMAKEARQENPPVVSTAAAVATQRDVDSINANITSRVARLSAVPNVAAEPVGEGDVDEETAENATAANAIAPAAGVKPQPQQPAAQLAQNVLPPAVAALQQPALKPVAAQPAVLQASQVAETKPTPAVEKQPAKLADKEEKSEKTDKPQVANSKAGRNWGIQVGAYNDRASGQRATALVADSMPDLLKKADPRVLAVSTSGGTIYRARLIGLDEREARTACTRLEGKGKPCLTLPPAGNAGAWLASAEQ